MMNQPSSRLRALASSVALLLLVATCAVPEVRRRADPVDPLEEATRATRADPAAASLLRPSARGFTRANGGATSSAAHPGRADEIDVRLPDDAREPIDLGFGR